MSGFLFMLLISFWIAGFILLFNGMVQLCVRNKTGPWKEGGASLLAGAIIVGVPIFLSRPWMVYHAQEGIFSLIFSGFLLVGLVLLFNGVVQLCVRNKTGPWKEGGASLLAGVIIAGVSVLFPAGTGIEYLLIAGLVLAFNGVVQLCVRNKTGPWKEGGASLLAGAIIAGVAVFWKVFNMPGVELRLGDILFYCVMAGLVLLFNGVVQVCVRNKTGPWKEGGASLLAGVIIAGTPLFLWLVGLLFRRL